MSEQQRTAPIDVAVGILMKPDGEILLGQRPAGKPYTGYWEFPGGKVDDGETILDALKREFVEELGIEIVSAEPWCCVEHVYPHAHVRLHFYISRSWRGEPKSREGQALAWQRAVEVDPILPATIPLMQWLDEMRPCCLDWVAAEEMSERDGMQGVRREGTGVYMDVHEDSEQRATPQTARAASYSAATGDE